MEGPVISSIREKPRDVAFLRIDPYRFTVVIILVAVNNEKILNPGIVLVRIEHLDRQMLGSRSRF
jgi:hypothetical protein